MEMITYMHKRKFWENLNLADFLKKINASIKTKTKNNH